MTPKQRYALTPKGRAAQSRANAKYKRSELGKLARWLYEERKRERMGR